jgi:hypothetical protein
VLAGTVGSALYGLTLNDVEGPSHGVGLTVRVHVGVVDAPGDGCVVTAEMVTFPSLLPRLMKPVAWSPPARTRSVITAAAPSPRARSVHQDRDRDDDGGLPHDPSGDGREYRTVAASTNYSSAVYN